jgi:phospholipid/cholesterol/gamma-HCH transport system permease protein
MEYVERRPGGDKQALLLKGEWTVGNAASIEQDLNRYRGLSRGGERIMVDASRIRKLDTAGAWLIREHLPGAILINLSKRQKALLDFLPGRHEEAETGQPPWIVRFFARIGTGTVWAMDFLFAIFNFLGMVFLRIAKNLFQPSHFRVPAILRHIEETGLRALPVVGALAFGISLVISYQGAVQLRKFGADIYTIDLTVISLLREMAVLVTAIMVAGRSGSAFAAEIGVMKVRGEVDALQTLGLDPIETLVAPRLMALLITLPALAFIAALVGLAGCGVMSIMQLDISASQYIDRVQEIATPTMFFIGMIKAPVFALLITAVCAYQGMSATGSAENVGKLTTLAVVQSIFLVIMADALFSVVFSEAGL